MSGMFLNDDFSEPSEDTVEEVNTEEKAMYDWVARNEIDYLY